MKKFTSAEQKKLDAFFESFSKHVDKLWNEYISPVTKVKLTDEEADIVCKQIDKYLKAIYG